MITEFEGPEKKFELLLDPGAASFRDRPDAYWAAIAESAGASVLSRMTNEYCDAYLLSESSLFVYADRVIMITCGCTTLVTALENLLQEVDHRRIVSLVFERKNENFPQSQPTTFEEDFERIAQIIPCSATEFGDPDGDCIKLFHLDRKFSPGVLDHTIELLMHGIADAPVDEIRRLFDSQFLDEYHFEPQGYSLNRLSGAAYNTVHATPEEPSSYVSFESNESPASGRTLERLEALVELCRPQRFDLLVFQHQGVIKWPCINRWSEFYTLTDPELRELDCGYRTTYLHGELL